MLLLILSKINFAKNKKAKDEAETAKNLIKTKNNV